jgi:hypothetical protein
MPGETPAPRAVGADATFYAVGDSRYFLPLVALLNSLRLTGHQHELVVGDCGLTADQRAQLRPCCRVFPLRDQTQRHPVLFKPFPYLWRPTGTVVIIDADMIVTGPLEPILSLAGQGKICAYPDPDHDRWFAEWQQLFDLAGAPRHQTYVSSHFVAFSRLCQTVTH